MLLGRTVPQTWPIQAFDPRQTGSRLRGDRWTPSTARSKMLFVSLAWNHTEELKLRASGWLVLNKDQSGTVFYCSTERAVESTRRERTVLSA